MRPAPGERWIHFKGNVYVIVRTVIDGEDPRVWHVIYFQEGKPDMWFSRTLKNFTEPMLSQDLILTPRFRKMP